MPVASAERGLLDVIFVDANLVISPMQVDLSEDLGTEESVSEVIDEGNQESVLDCDVVQCMIVNTYSKGPILFLDEHDQGTEGGHTRFNQAILEELIQLF